MRIVVYENHHTVLSGLHNKTFSVQSTGRGKPIRVQGGVSQSEYREGKPIRVGSWRLHTAVEALGNNSTHCTEPYEGAKWADIYSALSVL